MKKVVFLVLAALVLISCNTQVPIDVTGTWSGSMTSSGAVPIELGLVDSGGAITGSMRYYDSNYGWRYFGSVTGSHAQDGSASFIAYASDGSGRIEFNGTFTHSSFSGSAALYDSNTYVLTATVSLAKE